MVLNHQEIMNECMKMYEWMHEKNISSNKQKSQKKKELYLLLYHTSMVTSKLFIFHIILNFCISFSRLSAFWSTFLKWLYLKIASLLYLRYFNLCCFSVFWLGFFYFYALHTHALQKLPIGLFKIKTEASPQIAGELFIQRNNSCNLIHFSGWRT